MPSASRAFGGPAEDTRAAIERFLKSSREPAILEPGEDLLPLASDNFVLDIRSSRLTLQAWDDRRNLVRRILGIRQEQRGRMELTVELFARREGRLFLIDLSQPLSDQWRRRGSRLIFRERFRDLLAREFPEWRIAELSAEPDLEQSLSPAYPRALLRKGNTGLAAIASDGAEVPNVLSFGLIWLDYLRRRERRARIEGLALFVPSGGERAVSLRMRWLNSAMARFLLFTYSGSGYARRLDPSDYGNLETALHTRRTCAPVLTALPLEHVERADGSVSLRVRGLEVARSRGSELLFGLRKRALLRDHNRAEFEVLVSEVCRMRLDRGNPLHGMQPEAWLESQVRSRIEVIDASLEGSPVHGQVPAVAGGDRGVLDLLAVDHTGRLAVMELKADADLHLPLQALDYWMRVAWHAHAGDFEARGYFPGMALRRESPRLILIAPALEFHPTTETILQYFSPEIAVERIGVGMDWRNRLEVMFRLRGAQGPV